MATYVILYNFTAEGAKNIRDSIKRSGRIRQDNARAGFKIKEVYWLQGGYDMMAIVDAPSEESMMGAMLNIVAAGNVSSTTMRAFDAMEMSKILAQTLPLHDDGEAAPRKGISAGAAPQRAGAKKAAGKK